MPARAAVSVETDTSRSSLPASGLVLTSEHVTAELAARAAALCAASEASARPDVFVLANAPSARSACTTRKIRLVARRLGLSGAQATDRRAGQPASWDRPGLAPWLPTVPVSSPPSSPLLSEEDAAGPVDVAPAARALGALTLPKGTLVVAVLPALAPPPVAMSDRAAAPTPLPPAAWFFGSAVTMLLLKRGARPGRQAAKAAR